jgi:hypothetical protein
LGTGIVGVPIVGTRRMGSAGFDSTFCTDTRNAVATGTT